MQFNPISAQKTLHTTAREFEKLQKELMEKRLAYAMTLAKLQDAEQEARNDIFRDDVLVKATQTRDWLKWRTHEEQKAHDQAQEAVRGLKEQIELRIEVLNALKASLRLWEMESKNLNLN